MKKQYIYSIDNLRGLAILLVFFTHCQSFNLFDSLFQDFAKFFVGNATAIFVFISGFLFHYLQSKNFNFKKYLKQKSKFVITPYLFFISIATIIGLFFHVNEYYQLTNLQFIIWSLSVGGTVVAPLWFIPMICLFFLTAPVFISISKVSLKIMTVITVVSIILSLITDRPFSQYNPFLSYIHFLGFYMLGVYLSASHKVREGLYSHYQLVYALTITFFCILLGFYLYTRYVNGSETYGFINSFGKFNLIQGGKLCMTILLFVAFEHYFNHKNKVLGFFSHISFGIFFIHGFMLIIFSKLVNQWQLTDHPFLLLILETIFGLGGSVLLIEIGKKILGSRSRYVLGC
jgi:peptidoglycan/LPS O-acetylase OafA/YrhL